MAEAKGTADGPDVAALTEDERAHLQRLLDDFADDVLPEPDQELEDIVVRILADRLAAVTAQRDQYAAQVARVEAAADRWERAGSNAGLGAAHVVRAALRADTCECPPCPGRGYDGHRMNHCAECCFGTGVEADENCPVHGRAALRADGGGSQ